MILIIKKIFTYQLESFASKGDLFIAFSCSGSSKNIIDALLFAKEKIDDNRFSWFC